MMQELKANAVCKLRFDEKCDRENVVSSEIGFDDAVP